MTSGFRSGITAYQYLAGLSDTGTGLLLIFAPIFTLRLMNIGLPPQPIAFASFVGVFVLGVGLSYLLSASIWPLSQRNAERWQMQWWLTAVIRSLVAVFLFVQIAAGRMKPAWLTVAFTDGVLALVQWTGLRRGWLQSAS